jgi:mannosyltransferase
MSRAALVMVFVALLAGAFLRFHHLDALQMSADEGATWAAADASSIGEVVELQQTHNPGKLPLHDLMLHGWIAIFGDSLFALRSLSAIFGLLTILLMFPLTREILRIPTDSQSGGFSDADADLVAALSALICAISLVTVKYDREARMYGALLTLTMAQLWFFLRALRRVSLTDCVVLALFTSALIAINPVTLLILFIESIWLGAMLVSRRIVYSNRSRTVLMAAMAILAGMAILAPALYAPITAGHAAISAGKFDWLIKPAWWEPLAFFNKATGSVAFPVLFALAAWGVWAARRGARGPLEFTLLVMWAPPVLLVAGSLLWRPIFIERYATYSFPAFFMLIAIGIVELKNRLAIAGATVAVVALALGHVHSYSLKTHDVDWRDAAHTAQASLHHDETIAVAPPYAVEVVRYYLAPSERDKAVSYSPATDHSAVAILAEHGVNRVLEEKLRADYPRMVQHASGVVVLSR